MQIDAGTVTVLRREASTRFAVGAHGWHVACAGEVVRDTGEAVGRGERREKGWNGIG